MPSIFMYDGGTLEQWIETFTNGCTCGGRTLAVADERGEAVRVTHTPPGQADGPATCLLLKGLQEDTNAEFERYRQWMDSIH